MNSAGARDAMQAPLKLWIVHPRLPGQQRQRLARAEHGGKVVVRHLRGIGLHSFGIVIESASAPRPPAWRRCREYRACRGGPTLMPTGPTSTRRRNRSGALVAISAAIQPPIEQPTRSTASSFKHVHQFEIEVGDIVDAVEPIRQARLAEARMRRRDQAALRGRAAQRRVAAD